MDKYDLIVCGGGTAGIAAGYIGAKYGLKTLIIEKNIHLGGSITSGLVIPAMKSNTQDINCEFYNDLIAHLKLFDGQITYGDGNKGWFNPELMKIALDLMLESVGCSVLYNTEVADIEFINSKFNKKQVTKVKLRSNVLSLYIEARYFVDATGNGNFSKILKNEILENNFSRQPMTLRFNVSGIDMKTFSDWIMELDKDKNVTTSYTIDGQIHLSTACTADKDRNWALSPLFEQGVETGELTEADSAYFQLFTIPAMPGTVSLNCPRIPSDKDIDPLDSISVSKGLITARKQIWRLYCFMKKHFKGFENSFISNIADMVGVRESRRVKGEKVLTKDDLLSGNSYENPVLHADYPIDIHSYKKDGSTLEKTTVDYELPFDCLRLSDYDNVFVIGRCMSADFEAQAALRIQTSCFSMGEAVAKYIKEKLRLK